MIRLFIICICLLALDAHAELRLEASGGTCKQTLGEEGSWYNKNYQTDVDLTSGCFQLGVSQAPWQWKGNNLGWRIAYVDLGSIHTDSIMAHRDDEQFKNPSGKDCDGKTRKGCLIHTVGGGHASGVSFGGLIERNVSQVVLTGEAGLYVYYNFFHLDIVAYPNSKAFPVSAGAHDDARGWQVTPYVGLGLRYGWATLNVRAYNDIQAHKAGCGGCSGITNGPGYSAMLGVTKGF